MTEKKAKYIRVKYALKSILIALIIFYFVPTIIFLIGNLNVKHFVWFLDLDFYNWVFILNWILFFIFFAYIFGRKVGFEIIIKNSNYIKTGMKYGFLTLLFSLFFGCFLGFFWEGIDNIGTNDNPFEDYFFKPMFWILIFGALPSILVGRWLGKKIKESK